MIFRDATIADLDAIPQLSMWRGPKNYMQVVDVVKALDGDKGELLGVGGIKVIAPNAALCWVDFARDAESHFVRTYRVMKDWLMEYARANPTMVIMAFVDPTFPGAVNMVEHLGFKLNGMIDGFFGITSAMMYILRKES